MKKESKATKLNKEFNEVIEYATSLDMPVTEENLGEIEGSCSRTKIEIEEYEAEFTAYVVCTRFGIENKAPYYLKGWGATRDRIKDAVGAVSKVSAQIINAVEVNES